MYRKFFVLVVLVMSSLSHSCIHAAELPDSVLEWHSVSEYVLPLVTSPDNKNFGRCVYKSYVREAPKSFMCLILSEGSGSGSLYVPEHVDTSKGVMQTSSIYDILLVSGHRAVLERHEYLPHALAVNVSKDIILTVEAGSLNDSELVELAEIVIENFSEVNE